MEVPNIVQEVVIKSTHKKRNCKPAKWLSEEALQIDEKRNVKQTRKHTATAILPPPPPELGVPVCCSECQEEGTTQPLLRGSHRAGVSR